MLRIVLAMCVVATVVSATEKSFDRRLTGFEYPFPVQSFDFQSQNQQLQMAYMDLMPETPNGKVFVLLHGKNFSGFYFEQIAKHYQSLGYRVIIPDQIGFGKSTKPEQFQYSFHGLAQYTDQLLKKLEVNRYSVLAHSMGGMLGMRMALMYPEKIEKLVVVAPLGLEDYRILVPPKPLDQVYKAELKTTAESIKKYQLDAYYDGQWKPEYEKLIVPSAGWTRHKDFPVVAWNAALTFDMIYTQPVVYELPSLKVPTTLIIGLKDKTAPGKATAKPEDRKKLGDFKKLGPETKKKIPNLTLIELKGQGHVPFLENFEEFKKHLQ